MKRLLDEIKDFYKCKVYLISLALIAACAYGYAITHFAIGMDDTAIPLYFEEGLAPYVGRWSLFVINKLFHIADFSPWIVEFASVLILMMSVTLWCVLWKRICEPRVELPLWSYVFVAGLFMSCPLISEVFVFYLHNGVCIGYGVTALALICLMNSLSVETIRKYRLGQGALSAVLLTVAMGFYESFVIVYIMGAVMCFFLLRRLYGKKAESACCTVKILPWMGNGILTVAVSVVARSVVLAVLKVVYRLEQLDSYNVLYRNLFGELFTKEGELVMMLKRFIMKYYIHALVYLPITVLVIALLFIGVYSAYCGIRRKDIILPICAIALMLLPIVMSLVEGLATRYRSAQYVPLVGAFAVLLVMLEARMHKLSKWIIVMGSFFMGILIFNQCVDMNKWFYLDNLKYENSKAVMSQIAYDLEEGYDISKPIVFRGAYTVPYEISEDAYISFSSSEYNWICRLTNWIDPHWKEKFYAPNGKGYIYVETPVISTLQWGVTAFDGTSQQLIEFWEMHGYNSFGCVTDLNVIEEAERIRNAENIPGYPRQGYIKECEDYIIVNFSDV